MSTKTLNELFRHMEWANARMWSAVLAAPAARGDDGLRERLVHIHVVQWMFLQIWLGRPPAEFQNQADFADLTAVADWGRKVHQETDAFIETLDESHLKSAVTLPWVAYFEKHFGKSAAAIDLEQSMLQVVMHTSHHRGQVNARLRDLKAEPPFVDFIVWLWHGQPAPEWPS